MNTWEFRIPKRSYDWYNLSLAFLKKACWTIDSFLGEQQSDFLLKIMLVTIWGRVGGDILLMITSLMLPIMNDRLNDNNVVAVAEDYDVLV